MTKTVRESIEDSFKDLLKEKPYKSISVLEICDHANVSRRAFYVVFNNKEAIVEGLFDQHIIQPMYNLHQLLSKEDIINMSETFNVRMYENLYAEREYYINLVKTLRGNDDTFLRVVTWTIYNFNIDHIPTLTQLPNDWRVDYIAYFFASSQAMWMQKWISDGMFVPPKDLAELYNKMTMSFWWGLAD